MTGRAVFRRRGQSFLSGMTEAPASAAEKLIVLAHCG
jgi:hypothetical protein